LLLGQQGPEDDWRNEEERPYSKKNAQKSDYQVGEVLVNSASRRTRFAIEKPQDLATDKVKRLALAETTAGKGSTAKEYAQNTCL